MNTNSTGRSPRQWNPLVRDPEESNLKVEPGLERALLPDELVAEHSKGWPPSPREIERLSALRIPQSALASEPDGEHSPLLKDRIVQCGRHFEFARNASCEEDVRPAFTIVEPGTGADAIDIVAFRPKPYLHLSLLGRVTLVGERQVLRPHLSRGLRVHRTLLGYLAHRRRGIVIMNFTRAALLLHDIRLIPEDDGHREELRRKLVAGPIVLEPGEE